MYINVLTSPSAAVAFLREQEKIMREHDQEHQERKAFLEARRRYCEDITDHNGDTHYAPRKEIDTGLGEPFATITRAEFDKIEQDNKARYKARQLAENTQKVWEFLGGVLPVDISSAMREPTLASMVEVLEANPSISEREAAKPDPLEGFERSQVSSYRLSVDALRQSKDWVSFGLNLDGRINEFNFVAILIILREESQRVVGKGVL